MGVSPVIIEKDFWVCWILKRVFLLEDQPALIFKGGTSLSKAYNLIQRFSEDIDLAFDRRELGFEDDRDPANVTGSNKRTQLLKELSAEAERHIRDHFLPALQATCADARATGDINLSIDEQDAKTLLVQYPYSLGSLYGGIEYIKPTVRLELGARSDQWPADETTVTPYAADHFPAQFQNSAVAVRTLSPRRTLWEKATIAHALFHRSPLEARHTLRQSRHYYDLAQMLGAGIYRGDQEDLDLLSAVVHHKSLFFQSAWAKYSKAAPGTLRITPHTRLEKALREDYNEMTEMIFGDTPHFDQILSALAQFETEVNSTL